MKVKHTFVGESVKDEKVEEHREQFTALVRELKNVFRHDGLAVTVTVLPNVNSTGTAEIEACLQKVFFINSFLI